MLLWGAVPHMRLHMRRKVCLEDGGPVSSGKINWPMQSSAPNVNVAHRWCVTGCTKQRPEPARVTVQAGPPYELDPYTLETKAGRPSSLDGWVPVGKAPSTTGSVVLDKVRARAHLASYIEASFEATYTNRNQPCGVGRGATSTNRN